MSRIGRKPIEIPAQVEVSIDNNKVKVKGPKGQLEQEFVKGIVVRQEDNHLVCERPNDHFKMRAYHGLVRSLLSNMVQGVTNGFSKQLVLVGVGYRASMKGDNLVLNVGYSNPVEMVPPAGVTVTVANPTEITVEGIDKQVVGQFAADIRAVRKPEPYKGKGIRYKGEIVRQKVGKSG